MDPSANEFIPKSSSNQKRMMQQGGNHPQPPPPPHHAYSSGPGHYADPYLDQGPPPPPPPHHHHHHHHRGGRGMLPGHAPPAYHDHAPPMDHHRGPAPPHHHVPPHHAYGPPPQHSAPPPPPQQHGGHPAQLAPTKLRAAATEWAPKGPPTPTGSDQPTQRTPTSATPPPQNDKEALERAEESKLSPVAPPYTPKRSPVSKSPPAFPQQPNFQGGDGSSVQTTPTTPTEPKIHETPVSSVPASPTKRQPTDLPDVLVEKPFPNSKLPREDPVPPPPEKPMPLHDSWMLYFDDHVAADPNEKGDYHNPIPIHKVATVEEFWRLMHNISMPTTRGTAACTYYFFRNDIKPSWEDMKNKDGGAFSTFIYDKDRLGLQDRDFMDDALLLALCAAAGESIGNGITTGVVLKVRKVATLQVWVKGCDKAELPKLAEGLRHVLEQGKPKQLGNIEFYWHSTLQQKAPTAKPIVGKPKKVTKPQPDMVFQP